MSSWRDGASMQSQDDLDRLISPALGFAQQQLGLHGEFFPYAVVVRSDGQAEMIAASSGADLEPSSSSSLITEIRINLVDRRNQLRAVAVVADFRITEGADAIRVELEHREGPTLTVLLPYSQGRSSENINYGQLLASEGTRHIWLS